MPGQKQRNSDVSNEGRGMKIRTSVASLAVLAATLAAASTPPEASRDGVYLATTTTQSEADEYTRYELLAPETASFRISYEVTATTAGAKFF